MKNARIKCILLVITILYTQHLLYSQQQLLDFSPGALSSSLGKSGVTEIYDPTALYWNPAALGYIRQHQITTAIHEAFQLNYTGYAFFNPLHGTFAVNIARTSKMDNAVEFGSIGWGRKLNRYFSFGASISALSIDRESWTTAGFGFIFKPERFLFDADNNHKNIFDSPLLANKLTIGVSVQNIPFIVNDYDHQIRVGGSYALFNKGPKVFYAHHFHRNVDTDHLGFEFPLLKGLEIAGGFKDFESRNFTFGIQTKWQNIGFDLSYDTNIEKIAVSTIFRIGPSPDILAQKEFNEAKKYLKDNDHRAALKNAKKAVAYDPGYMQAANLENSLSQYIKNENNKIDSLLLIAKSYEEKSWYIKAAALYLRILKINPNHEKATEAFIQNRPKLEQHIDKWFNIAVDYFNKESYAEAQEIFESIMLVRPDHYKTKSYLKKIDEINKKYAENHFYTGLGFYSQRNYKRAEEEFLQSLKFDANYTDSQEYLKKIQDESAKTNDQIETLEKEAQFYENQNALIKAKSRYQKILSLNPKNESASNKIDNINARLSKIISYHLAQGEKALKDEDYVKAEQHFRNVLKIQHHHPKAGKYISQITQQTNSKTDQYIIRAKEYIQQQQWEYALAALDSALVLDPKFNEAILLKEQTSQRYNLEQFIEKGKSDFLSGRYLEALEYFDKALEIDPHNEETLILDKRCRMFLNDQVDDYFNRGLKLYTEEKYELAIYEWNKALQIDPSHKGSLEYKANAEKRLQALNNLE